MAELTSFLPLAGDQADLRARLHEEPDRWLPADSRQAGPNAWRIPLQGLGLVRTVRCTVGPAIDAGEGTWRAVVWTPTPEPGDVLPMERLLPELRGEIGVVGNGGPASIVLTGEYRAPVGPLGQVADALLLHLVARSTAETFLRGVADRLTANGAAVGAATRTDTAPEPEE